MHRFLYSSGILGQLLNSGVRNRSDLESLVALRARRRVRQLGSFGQQGCASSSAGHLFSADLKQPSSKPAMYTVSALHIAVGQNRPLGLGQTRYIQTAPIGDQNPRQPVPKGLVKCFAARIGVQLTLICPRPSTRECIRRHSARVCPEDTISGL